MLSKSTYGLVAALGIGAAFAAMNACSKTPPEPVSEKPTTTSTAPAVSGTSTIVGSANSGATPTASGSAASSASGSSGGAPAAGGPDELAWEAPSTWQSVPNPNPMRKATYKIPKAGGDADDAELTVSAAAGGVEQNIKRWEGQFGPAAKAKTEPRTPNGLKVTLVEIKGTFAGGGMMGAPAPPKKDQMLLGAVVDAGDKQHFFKMVGGEKTVTAAKKDFDKFVASFRAK